MHIAGVDIRHEEWGHPDLQIVIVYRPVARRLLRSLEARCQREWIPHQRQQTGILCRGLKQRPAAGRRPAREGPFHRADATLDPGDRCPELFLRGLLTAEDAQFKWQGIIAAGEHDPRTAALRGGLMRIDDPPHPWRLATQIEIVCA